ncbi:single-stranded DNA-binding protein [Neisseria sp.]|uniref:single-stranded DNA-binding protein n=1 Tax=Neisseria sp. TaxID=192066 RepID=UPI0035A19553
MSSLNKVILIGHLGRDPDTRYMSNGEPVCNFSMATSEAWNDRNTGQRQERTEWHNITLYRRLAEIAAQYLRKGSQVYIEGRIQSRKYTGKDGIERTAYDIIGSEMKMLGSKSNGAHPSQTASAQQGTSAPMTAAQYAAASGGSPIEPPVRKQSATSVAPVDDIDDDIPF